MLQLIKTELRKIFHKKSIYIIFTIMAVFCLLNNVLYKNDYDENGIYKYLEQEDLNREEQTLQKELKKYNKDNIHEVSMYITIKTKLDIIKLKKSFSNNSWQYRKINDYLYNIVYQLNNYEYTNQTTISHTEINKKYQTILKNLKENNWQYFIEQEKIKIEENISFLEQQLVLTLDKKDKLELENQISEQKFNLKILVYRIQNNIKEDAGFLNIALESYQENYKKVEYYQELNFIRNHQEELNYNKALINLKINEYILKYQQNINKQNNLNYQLRTIIEDYEIFFVILILILSGTIICDEFRDGTIKLLLIKPYSRGKILLSKYFTIIIVIGISILCLIMLQTLIGGILFGVDSLKLPVVIYDLNKLKIIEYSVIEYMGIRVISRIPFFIMLISIALLIGVISNSSIISVVMPLMLYMFTPTLENLTVQYNLTFMKYLVNINWNLQEYLFGNLSEIPYLSVKWSISILIIYFIGTLILTFKIFKKKNIKNI